MARAWDFVRNFIVFFCLLSVGADSEECTSSVWSDHSDEETSLLQVAVQTDTSRSEASGPWREKWLAKVAAKSKARMEWAKEKMGEGELQDQQTPEEQEGQESTMSMDAALDSADPEPDDGTSINPFTKVSFELAEECPEIAGQADCDEAIWLAGLLTKLTRGKSSDLIAEAARLLSLQAWFSNPAGPSGFFNFLDTDRNGELDAKDLADYGGVGLLKVIDVNRDGYASREECQTFLRGCAILFKVLPTEDSGLAEPLHEVHTPEMLKLADTVAFKSTVAVSPSANPLMEVASSIKKDCPPSADAETCKAAVDLAKLLVNLTADTPAELVVSEASSILSLWYWFQNPHGPAGFFEALDKKHKGSITSSDLMSIPGTSPKVAHLMTLLDRNRDGAASRAECHSYLRACVLLIHKLPMLDLASANTPVDDMFNQVDSVIKQAVIGSSPMAWAISMSISSVLILAILYVHCLPYVWSRKVDKDRSNGIEQDLKTPVREQVEKAQHQTDESPDSFTRDASGCQEPPRMTGPPRIGSTFACRQNCALGGCRCHYPTAPAADSEAVKRETAWEEEGEAAQLKAEPSTSRAT